MSTLEIHIAKNGRYHVRLPGGRTQFISDAEAKKLLGSTGPKTATRRAPAEKAATRRAAPGSARVSVRGQAEIDFNERQVGTILRGFIEAARGKKDDPARLFGDAPEAPRADAMLLELGREVFGHMPAALAYFKTSPPTSGAPWYKRDAKARTSLTPAAQPFSPAPTAWMPPVIGTVTSRFGSPRDGGRHEGIDIALPVGTPVVAPVDLEIKEVSFGQKAGRKSWLTPTATTAASTTTAIASSLPISATCA